LRHALPDIDQRQQQRQRQQHAPEHAHKIHPVVADVPAACTGQPAHKTGSRCQASSGACKHQPGDHDHLRGIAQAVLARIRLPVGVGDEGCGGVERQVRRLRGVLQRVQRQAALQPQQQVAQQHQQAVAEHQHRAVALPAHALLRIHADGGVGPALQPAVVRTGKAACQPPPHGDGEQHQHRHEGGIFDPD